MEAAGTEVGVEADGGADGAAGAAVDGAGARALPWALLPHLPGVSDPAGAGVPGGAIPIGTPPVRGAAGCLFESGVSAVRCCALSGAAGDLPQGPGRYRKDICRPLRSTVGLTPQRPRNCKRKGKLL
jgi:hypothetical protein